MHARSTPTPSTIASSAASKISSSDEARATVSAMR